MINVGIVSSKDEVSFNMATVVCKVGAHCERMIQYDFNKIKTFDIAIIDLDNLGDWESELKNTAPGFADMVVAGFSRSQETMDSFRALMTVKQKPFRKDHMLTFLEDLKHIVKKTSVVNTEETPIYTRTGTPTFERDALNTDVFSNEEMSIRLSKIINEKYKGPSEKEFLKQIDLDQVPVQSHSQTIAIEQKPPRVDLISQFVDDALLMYRAQKLRKLRLSPDEIKNRVKALMMFDALHGESKNKIDTDELERRLEAAKKLHEEASKNANITEPTPSQPPPAKQFTGVRLDIDAQRQEVIRAEETHPEVQIETPQIQNTGNFNDAELKYIKQPAKTSTPPASPTAAVVPKNQQQGVVMDKAELSKKLQGSMTQDQIEKLRKLGVKI